MQFRIGTKNIGDNFEPFIIAEAGINHNGDIELAKSMIITAKRCGADAVKFQTFHTEEFIQDKSVTYTYMSQGKEVTESMYEMFRRNEFSKEEWSIIKHFCIEQDILFLSTPQNVSDLELLLELGIEAIKVGSDDFVNIPLIRRYSQEKLPMLLSCGMADKAEIDTTLSIVKNNGNSPVVLLLCTSQYPTPPEDVNISKLITMHNRYPDVVLGFSDHTQRVEAAIMATALGARVFEKHFTLSHNLKGPDHWFSSEPQELKKWCDSIRTAYEMIGYSDLKPSESEQEMRNIAHRSITALKDIHTGEFFMDGNIGMRRPGDGIAGAYWDDVVSKKAKHEIKAGKQIKWEDIDE